MITSVKIVFTELDLFQDGDQFDERTYSEEARAEDVARMMRKAFQQQYPKAKIDVSFGQQGDDTLEYVDDVLGSGYAGRDVAHIWPKMMDLLNGVFTHWRQSWLASQKGTVN